MEEIKKYLEDQLLLQRHKKELIDERISRLEVMIEVIGKMLKDETLKNKSELLVKEATPPCKDCLLHGGGAKATKLNRLIQEIEDYHGR